jgi:GTPase Era involved in 16S rRNA processing
MRDANIGMLRDRLARLEAHLKSENPVLAEAVQGFRQLDGVAYALGLLGRDESFATRVSWWPVIAVVGTFSSGKSSFINHYLETRLQATGNQAVDDRFTVICFGEEPEPRVLPGLALDSDPRFPFYRISEQIEQVAEGEGRRLNSYLQLKTCSSERVRGKILIDSPGFDADEQRTSTLHIIDHIFDLSDLVLVFFDARHPEPGAMKDTLDHLVTQTIHRSDASKFLYILNQIDATAREDNPEEVFAAWQRALAQRGLTAGRFYRTYNPEAAAPIENEERRRRFERKREEDVTDIYRRMHQVEVERAYRVTGVLEKTAKRLRDELVPAVTRARRLWRRRIRLFDSVVFGALVAVLLGYSIYAGWWDGLQPMLPGRDLPQVAQWVLLGSVALVVIVVHRLLRRAAAQTVVREIRRDASLNEVSKDWVLRAFERNVRAWRAAWSSRPVGWRRGTRQRLAQVLMTADQLIQRLNDQFTHPSGAPRESAAAEPVAASPDREAGAAAQPLPQDDEAKRTASARHNG